MATDLKFLVVLGSNDLLHPKTFIIFIRYWSSLYADPREFLLQFSLNLAKSIVPVKDKDSSHALRAGQELHIFLTFYQCLPVSSFWFWVWESSSSCKSTPKKKKNQMSNLIFNTGERVKNSKSRTLCFKNCAWYTLSKLFSVSSLFPTACSCMLDIIATLLHKSTYSGSKSLETSLLELLHFLLNKHFAAVHSLVRSVQLL